MLEAAAKRAKIAKVSIGKAVSELARRGMQLTSRVLEKDGLFLVDLPADSPKVTSRRVKQIESQGI